MKVTPEFVAVLATAVTVGGSVINNLVSKLFDLIVNKKKIDKEINKDESAKIQDMFAQMIDCQHQFFEDNRQYREEQRQQIKVLQDHIERLEGEINTLRNENVSLKIDVAKWQGISDSLKEEIRQLREDKNLMN